MRRDCPNTALNYYQNLLRRRIVSEGRETTQRLPEHCPSAFYNKNSELTSPLIEIQILPIIFRLYYPETEKGQNRSPVISGVNNYYYYSYLINVFYKIGGDKISGRLFVNSIDCYYFCYGGKIYSGNNKTRWYEIL